MQTHSKRHTARAGNGATQSIICSVCGFFTQREEHMDYHLARITPGCEDLPYRVGDLVTMRQNFGMIVGRVRRIHLSHSKVTMRVIHSRHGSVPSNLGPLGLEMSTAARACVPWDGIIDADGKVVEGKTAKTG